MFLTIQKFKVSSSEIRIMYPLISGNIEHDHLVDFYDHPLELQHVLGDFQEVGWHWFAARFATCGEYLVPYWLGSSDS